MFLITCQPTTPFSDQLFGNSKPNIKSLQIWLGLNLLNCVRTSATPRVPYLLAAYIAQWIKFRNDLIRDFEMHIHCLVIN